MNRLFQFAGIAALAMMLILPGNALASGKTELIWYGQSAFKITTPAGKVLLIDPWIVNPLNKNSAADLASLTKVDYLLITHGHGDHIGNGVEIAKKTGAKLVANYDLGRALVQYGGFPTKQAERTYMGFPGGEVTTPDNEVTIRFVPAVHSSIVEGTLDSPLPGKVVYGGTAGGFVIMIKDGPTIYHTGDTDIFSDMALIGALTKIDIMLACIGGHFTMGPKGAALAAKLVNPGLVIPMHFGSNPLLKGTPEQFKQELANLPKDGNQPSMKLMTVGEALTWNNK